MSQLWRRFSRSAPAVPVCVMMPLEFPVLSDEDFHNLVEGSLPHLVGASGISGVMVDLWWGLCEIRPREYTWCGERYKTLFRMCRVLRIKCQVVLCFHMCGGNVGDSVSVSLPEWVSARAKELQETADTCILYRDRHGYCNPEYISCGADNEPLFPLPTEADGGNGSTSQPRLRTPVECYAEFVNAFADEFGEEFFGDVIHEIHVGLGPAGEIRYPSYPLAKGIWEFPGIGEFQCYDTFLSKDLEKSLEGQNFSNEELAQCLPPRETAGSYKDEPYATEFFSKLVDTRAGKHFLRWYSDKLLQHADTVLTATKHALRSYAEASKVRLCVKVSGVHWWFNTKSHAAEQTAGYYHIRGDRHTFYDGIAKVLKKHGGALNFTCFEMSDGEQPVGKCSPEGLVRMLREAAAANGVPLGGENALPRYDPSAFKKILQQSKPGMLKRYVPRRFQTRWEDALFGFTFLRLGPDLLDEGNLHKFAEFVRMMQR
ncbi:hypothetical protein CDCA_CDCA08G2387 [Cyanidium caldarium]|uniref:Beta-amylase n=1 Tax=Cyanidium caldarium TaxID=2771 RepID=A0AAV9IVS8_CYACA|nr:hypothetical protein CDCA_CDCA08G2387 [Cyanidium caldarium]